MGERRLTGAAVARIAAGLSERDRAILADVGRVRVLTGRQVERLHFAGLQGAHRDRTRRRVLERLVSLQVLATLERRIGGVRAGSAGLVFALGPAGQRLLALDSGHSLNVRARRPSTPTERFLDHCLAVAELYVSLVDAERTGSLTLVSFAAEPDCWWRDSEGEWVKPDAHAVISSGDVEDHWAIEVEISKKSEPAMRRKLTRYLSLAANGEHGPDGVLPRVLVTVPHESRRATLRGLVSGLPPPASGLVTVVLDGEASLHLGQVLRE